MVYAVEFSHRPGRDLINMAKLRTNVIPIVEVRFWGEALLGGGTGWKRITPCGLTLAHMPVTHEQDARHPLKYRMLVGMVDTIFADVAQPDQARIVALNAHYFLKTGGHIVVSIKASCIDSTAAPEAVFQKEVRAREKHGVRPAERAPRLPPPCCLPPHQARPPITHAPISR